ncbi:MAG: hypothetical protein ACTICV_07135 [Corynebacterium variabile]|uniref:hypothetical protein n=1 Tax=Corynebacterium variabile TaxID=1727 RepID=UPI003F8E9491
MLHLSGPFQSCIVEVPHEGWAEQTTYTSEMDVCGWRGGASPLVLEADARCHMHTEFELGAEDSKMISGAVLSEVILNDGSVEVPWTCVPRIVVRIYRLSLVGERNIELARHTVLVLVEIDDGFRIENWNR